MATAATAVPAPQAPPTASPQLVNADLESYLDAWLERKKSRKKGHVAVIREEDEHIAIAGPGPEYGGQFSQSSRPVGRPRRGTVTEPTPKSPRRRESTRGEIGRAHV